MNKVEISMIALVNGESLIINTIFLNFKTDQ